MWVWLLIQLSSGAAIDIPETLEAINVRVVASSAVGLVFASSTGIDAAVDASHGVTVALEP